MEQESFHVLEYDKIRSLLAERAGSVLGKERAISLTPSSEFEEVEERLRETAEAVRVHAISSPPLGGIRDNRESLKKAAMGSALDPEEILDILSSMYAMRGIKRFFKELEEDVPLLKECAAGIEILGNLERHLESAIGEHGEVRDTASIELGRIRMEMRSSQSRVKERISSILHDGTLQKYFQETIVTQRNDRYVIPVKQEYRQRFPGIVHDQSSTGATLFIEPMDIVNLGNDIRQLELSEQHEVSRILRTLSSDIAQHKSVLQENSNRMADLDFAFAKAKLAADMNAHEPQLSREGLASLPAARHPLIPHDRVVPINIELGGSFRVLVVTGPNTGGKTVSMKTLGLMALMAQSGCFLPTGMGAQIPVYRNIYADIGDEQSIEQSLSTFSAHMTHLVSILAKSEPEDLLLLDELGAGTDPEEGAALAMAILERIMEIRASTVATTHYSELKTFAYSRDGIENACVEFDIETLRPTYRLLIGIPGASNAFIISERLGLSKSLVLRAQQLVNADHARFEQVISGLESEKLMYEERNADILERQKSAALLEKKAIAMREELYKSKGEIIRKAREKSAAMIRQARREAEEIIDSLKEQFQDQGVKRRQQAIQEARDRLRAAEEASSPGIMAQQGYRKRIDPGQISPGDIVYVTKLDQKGTVVSVHGKELSVQIGSLRANLPASVCRFVSGAPKELPSPAEKSAHSGTLLQKTASIRREIDIRGLMVDEAEQTVGKFLDDAVMAGIGQVLIIHGKGTGALRKGVHAYLKHHKNVMGYAFADMTEGGTGATVVDLK